MNKEKFGLAAAALTLLTVTSTNVGFADGLVENNDNNLFSCQIHIPSEQGEWTDFSAEAVSVDVTNNDEIISVYVNSRAIQNGINSVLGDGESAPLVESALNDAEVSIMRDQHALSIRTQEGVDSTQELDYWDFNDDRERGYGERRLRFYGSNFDDEGIGIFAEQDNWTGRTYSSATSRAGAVQYDSIFMRDHNGEEFLDSILSLDIYDEGAKGLLQIMFRTKALVNDKEESVMCWLYNQPTDFVDLFVVKPEPIEI